MPYRSLEGGIYHIYNRGFDKKTIFHRPQDFARFLTRMEFLLSDRYRDYISIHAFCLLPNHFHFVLSGEEVHTPLFLRDLQNSYAKYHNYVYQERGTLFEGRYCAKLLKSDDYLSACMSYVCYNALKHELVQDIRDWPWTSYHEIVEGLVQPHIPRVTLLDDVQVGGYVDIDEE